MIQIEINNRRILMVEVPEYCDDYFIGSGDTPFCENPDADYLNIRYDGTGKNMALPPGSWQLLGRGSEIDESKCAEIMDTVSGWPNKIYYNYDADAPGSDYRDIVESAFDTATESLHSLIKSKGLKPETTVLLIDKQ